MPNPVKTLNKYIRFALELRRFLRQPITLEEAKAVVRRRMEQREDNFLRLLERGIFGHAKSPYLPLLKLAHCELGDLQRMVHSKGLEGALQELRKSGVYISFEEFKGRQPIVRNGHVIPVKPQDFDNPHLSHYYYSHSGGTTGPGTRVSVDLDHIASRAPHLLLAYEAHGEQIHLVSQLRQRAQPAQHAERRATRLEKRLRRNHQDLHGCS